jgi:hypothetical protein
VTRDNAPVTVEEFDELLGEFEEETRRLGRQVERVAEQRARGDAAVWQDLERRLAVCEKNAAIGLAQSAPRDRRRQRERTRPVLTAEVLEKRADGVADEDATLSRGFRDWAAEKEREADG